MHLQTALEIADSLISDWSRLSLKLNFSEEHYFENILENLKSEAHKSLKKLREPVDPNLYVLMHLILQAVLMSKMQALVLRPFMTLNIIIGGNTNPSFKVDHTLLSLYLQAG